MRRPFSHLDYRGRSKVGFSTPERAMAAARRVASSEDWPQDVYQCRRCEHWHHGKADDRIPPQVGTRRVSPDGTVLAG